MSDQDDAVRAADEAEAEAYEKQYAGTEKLLVTSAELFNEQAQMNPSLADRELFRGLALEAYNELELLRSKRRAFHDGEGMVARPTREEMIAAQALTQRLANLAAAQAHTYAVVKVITDAVDELNRADNPV